MLRSLETSQSRGDKDLLDYLSYQLMNDYNWNLKSLLKEMVMSATYREDSKITKEALEKDPYNKLYARVSRVRLSAEQVRDQALCISGLMCTKMYGPSVMPWEPAGIWQSPWNRQDWVVSKGDDQYRRTVYTYWKRTAAYPSTVLLDGADREVCTARRIRTNTPLQALVTLNDSAYIDAARHFAYRMQSTSPHATIAQTISNGYALMLYKPIEPPRLQALQNLYNTAYMQYKNNAAATCEICGVTCPAHICKPLKADTQRQSLQKSLPCSYASGTHPTSLDTVSSLTQQDEGRTYNRGFAKIRADGSYLRH